MTASAAFVANGRLDIVATNSLGWALNSPLFDAPRRPANFARFQFLDPRARDFYQDWEGAANITVALLRAEAGRYPSDTQLRELVGELSTVSEEFRTAGPRTTSGYTTTAPNGSATRRRRSGPRLLHHGPAHRGPPRSTPDHLHGRTRVTLRGRPQAVGQLGGDHRRHVRPRHRSVLTPGLRSCPAAELTRLDLLTRPLDGPVA
jgi:hypothetical protein